MKKQNKLQIEMICARLIKLHIYCMEILETVSVTKTQKWPHVNNNRGEEKRWVENL